MHTERLDLRPVSLHDLDALFEINTDPGTWRHDPPGRHRTPDATRAWIERCVEKWDLDGLSYWTVRLRSDDTTVGVGGVQRQPFGWNLYYRLRPSAWGHGYATELSRAALEAAAAADPGAPVIAWIDAHNTASRRVAERLGLTDQGLHPDRTHDNALRHAYSTAPYPPVQTPAPTDAPRVQ